MSAAKPLDFCERGEHYAPHPYGFTPRQRRRAVHKDKRANGNPPDANGATPWPPGKGRRTPRQRKRGRA